MRVLADLDLNLLVVLRHLLQERSVAGTAKKMRVTPSTVSKALARLREWFGDPLFVRRKRGLEPTALALALEAELGAWFRLGDRLANASGGAAAEGAVFRLALESPFYVGFLSELPMTIYSQHPGATVRMTNWDHRSLGDIVDGDVDLGFCARETHPRSLSRVSGLPYYIDHEVLFSDRPVAFLRRDHPALAGAWRLADFLACPHIGVTWEASDDWALDSLLAEEGLSRRMPVRVSSFEQALYIAAQPGHELIAIAPSYCAKYALRHHDCLIAAPLPLEERLYRQLEISFVLLWHKRDNYDGKVAWLRSEIRRLYAAHAPNGYPDRVI